jgi:hypothetical protein
MRDLRPLATAAEAFLVVLQGGAPTSASNRYQTGITATKPLQNRYKTATKTVQNATEPLQKRYRAAHYLVEVALAR